jgi:hypothetical protein
VLRPLSALHLAPTPVEETGAILRLRLENIQGRSRRAQMELARRTGVDDPPTPSGDWSRLADPKFVRRLRDLLSHRTRALSTAEVRLLPVGRHLRLTWEVKLIVGRDETESGVLEQAAGQAWTCRVADRRGAVGLVAGEPDPETLRTVGAVCARYSASRELPEVEVLFRRPGEWLRLQVAPIGPEAQATLTI